MSQNSYQTNPLVLPLPAAVGELVKARDELASHYKQEHLAFTFDGKLVGDIGEAVAAEFFEIKIDGKNRKGVDGFTRDGKSVQVKASSVFGGAAFRPCREEHRADYLLFFHLDFENFRAEVVYNGPENYVRRGLENITAQRMVPVNKLRQLHAEMEHDRLPMKKVPLR